MVLPTVFEAFPNAVISGVWEIGQFQRGTRIGNIYTKYGDLDVIIDEGSNTSIESAPNASPLISDILLYVKPEQLPTIKTNELVASCIVYDSENDDYYAVIDAGVGKNQENGQIEHLELKLRQTEAFNAE